MWTTEARDLVESLIAALPTDLPPQTLESAQRLGALPIGTGLWAEYYLRPGGEVVIVGADLDRPDEITVATERKRVLEVLTWGGRRYPALLRLIPARPPDGIDCGWCSQKAQVLHDSLIFAEMRRFLEMLICQECGGVGWVPSDESLPVA